MLTPIPQILEELRQGKMIILVDDEDRENEGDLVLAAEKVTPEAINFMARYGRGLICMPMEDKDIKRLGLPPWSWKTRPNLAPPFMSPSRRRKASPPASTPTTGPSILVAADPASTADDLVRPGHVFPLRAAGGVLVRAGQTEGSSTSCAWRAATCFRHLRNHER